MGDNTTRKWPTRRGEKRARMGVLATWLILYAMIAAYLYAPELRAFFN